MADSECKEVLPIIFTEEYAAALNTVNTFVNNNELSEASLQATIPVLTISMGNYAIWAFRRRCLQAVYGIGAGELTDEAREVLTQELDMNAQFMGRNPKNYQLWQQRIWAVTLLNDAGGEDGFTRTILGEDAKNYHAWQHRMTIVKRFSWPVEREVEYAENLIKRDRRNNSAWAYLCAFKLGVGAPISVLVELVEMAAEQLSHGPNNEAAANVVSGALAEMKERCDADPSLVEGGLSMKLFPTLTHVLEVYGRPESCPVSPCLLALVLKMDTMQIDRSGVTEDTPAQIAAKGISLELTRQRWWIFLQQRAEAGLAAASS